MMRGSKSRRAKLIPGAVLVTLVAAWAIAPGPVVAAPANNEYSLDLPTGDGGGQDPTANASGVSGTDQPASGGSTESSGSTATGSGSSSRSGAEEDSGGSDDSNSAGGAAGKGGSNGGGKQDAAAASEGPVESTVGSSTAASDSDDGGVSIFLIIIAVVAAAAVGLAIWRIRSGRSDGDVGGQAAGVKSRA